MTDSEEQEPGGARCAPAGPTLIDSEAGRDSAATKLRAGRGGPGAQTLKGPPLPEASKARARHSDIGTGTAPSGVLRVRLESTSLTNRQWTPSRSLRRSLARARFGRHIFLARDRVGTFSPAPAGISLPLMGSVGHRRRPAGPTAHRLPPQAITRQNGDRAPKVDYGEMLCLRMGPSVRCKRTLNEWR